MMIRWARANLFSTPLNTVLTLAALGLLYAALPPFVDWAILTADWQGETRADCTSGGACWVFIHARIDQFIYGFYPAMERWRVDAAFIVLIAAVTPLFLPMVRGKGVIGVALVLLFPWVAVGFFSGGIFTLPAVETEKWGGLMLTLIVAGVGITASLPVGILLALGRQSSMPVIRTLCILFIELWRGVPLITVLFMAAVMLPLFLPDGMTLDKLLRALIGVSLFAGAYMAEVVRGGLQAIPRGQYEAAAALGLGYWRTMGFVILPQALRHVIPGLINTVIALFKDTTLVLIIGMFDFLGIIQAALTDPDWLGFALEGYVFAALVYWVICFSLSRLSLAVERRAPGYRAPIAGAMT
ncbi:MAG: amino acid ABC transporter permease [Rhodospirillaceae bacterium]|nr:amino acid ABC transporter permease [Rhodospirillaceae bacterium]